MPSPSLSRVVLVLRSSIEIAYNDHIEVQLKTTSPGIWDSILAVYRDATIVRLYDDDSVLALNVLLDRAASLSPSYERPAVFRYYAILTPTRAQALAIAEQLSLWTTVIESAYVDPDLRSPGIVGANSPYLASQRYLQANLGVDAYYAWDCPGGSGSLARIVDIEQGWTIDHEDLPTNAMNYGLLRTNGVIDGITNSSERPHGTAVLGILCACDNSIGCVGLAHGIGQLEAMSYVRRISGNRVYDLHNAIVQAAGRCAPGDVLLIEVEAGTGGVYYPVEAWSAYFTAIGIATASHITVIEPAGNSSQNISGVVGQWGDSGAIIVGASTSTSPPYERLSSSNFGSRVNCFAWGEGVATCYSNSAGYTNLYHASFGGTSAASAIVAGCASLVQSIKRAISGTTSYIEPLMLRQWFDAHSTASRNTSDMIGTMPDLRSIAQSELGQVHG